MPKQRPPVQEYLKPQGRFRHLTPDQVQMIQARVDREYRKLMNKVEHSQSWSEV
jgi:pyruvate ferredoxin oxidoreductase beta subunit